MLFKKNKIAVIGDIHLGIKQNSEQWHKIAFDWAKWVIPKLKAQGIADIVFLGDIFHERDEVAVNTLDVAARFLKMFDGFSITIIVGNHDAFYRDEATVNSLRVFDGWSNIRVIDKVITEEHAGKKISFIPWAGDISNLEKSDVIFGHLEIESFKMNAHKICDEGMKISDLLNKSNLIISGHFHLREEREYPKGKILYTGNPFEMDFGDENNIKGYYILDTTTMKYQFFVNEISPNHIKINLSDLVRHKTITEEVKRMFKGNVIKLVIDRNMTTDDGDKLLFRLTQLQPLRLDVDYDVNFNKIEAINQNNVDMSSFSMTEAINEFVSILDIKNKSETITYITDLYNKYKK